MLFRARESYILTPMYACHYCGADVGNPREIFRNSTCSGCGKDLKICLNCRFYAPGAHWDCNETVEELVADKERANFCSYFAFADKPSRGRAPNAADNARNRLDKLFGND